MIAVQTAADILSDCEISTIDVLITAGVIPKLVDFLGFDDKYILKFILFSTHKYDFNFFLFHMKIFYSCDLLVESVSVIQGITCGTAEHVKALVDAAAISPLIALLASTVTDVLHSAIVTLLANIVLCGSELRDRIISEGLVAPLVGLIKPNIPVNQD